MTTTYRLLIHRCDEQAPKQVDAGGMLNYVLNSGVTSKIIECTEDHVFRHDPTWLTTQPALPPIKVQDVRVYHNILLGNELFQVVAIL